MAWNLGQFYSACYSLRGSQAVASAAPAKQRYYFSNQQKQRSAVADTYCGRFPLPTPALATNTPTKMMKESGVPAGREVYYNSRFSDPGKEAQGTSTPRPMCQRMSAHGPYFCPVSTIHTVWWMFIITSMRAMVAILFTILTRNIYQRTVPRRSALTPAAPQRNSPTQDVSPLV